MTERILICTDLDRTLIPNGNQPESPAARPLFRQIAARTDVALAYVTGRHLELLLGAIREYELPLPDFAIGDVGTTIYEVQAGVWIKWQAWEQEIDRDWQPYRREDLAQRLESLSELKLQEAEKQNTHKLSYYTSASVDPKELHNAVSRRLAALNIQYNIIWSIDETTHTGLLDILPQRANKLEAIRFLMRQRDFSPANTVFAGDSGNDLEVLRSEINAILVHNASPEVRDAAVQQSKDAGHQNSLYLARGDFIGMNGNYAGGILEGLAHYLPHTRYWLEAAAAAQS